MRERSARSGFFSQTRIHARGPANFSPRLPTQTLPDALRPVLSPRPAYGAPPRYPSPVGLGHPASLLRPAPARGAWSRTPCMGGAPSATPVTAGRTGPGGAPWSVHPGQSGVGDAGDRNRGPGARGSQPALPALWPPLGLPAQPPRTPASDPPTERVCDADAAAAAAVAGRGRRARRGGGGERRGGEGGRSEITSPTARPAPPRRTLAPGSSRARLGLGAPGQPTQGAQRDPSRRVPPDPLPCRPGVSGRRVSPAPAQGSPL